jgi:hypothetical protein
MSASLDARESSAASSGFKLRLFFRKTNKYDTYQVSHGVNPEKFRKDLGSDPQNSRQILTNFGKKTHDFLDFCLFWRNFKSFPETLLPNVNAT